MHSAAAGHVPPGAVIAIFGGSILASSALVLPTPPSPAPGNLLLPDECRDATVLAIHKPRGVLSATGPDLVNGRRTLTDLMVAAAPEGIEPIPGHVGRLDLDTSGLILVTTDGLLLEAALGVPSAESLHESSPPLRKVYTLLLAGRHAPDGAAIESLRDPLVHQRGGMDYYSDGATVEHVRSFRSEELAAEHAFIDRDDDDADAKKEERAALRAGRAAVVRSRKTGQIVRPYVPFDGWLTEVKLTIAQGRHRQIRRLCKRAGLKLRHLRRIAFGPVELGGMVPGDVRALGLDEKAELYRACLPGHTLEGAHGRRSLAMEVARAKRRGTDIEGK